MKSRPRYVMYLAVLPKYRQECIEILKGQYGSALELYASPTHLDTTVKTGIAHDLFTEVKMLRIIDKAFLQIGNLRRALSAEVTVVDLNPRSLSAWALLVARRSRNRRTLVWGHLFPRAGSVSKTAGLRRKMRRLSTGTITYTYTQAAHARSELPGNAVWVAPNSLYRAQELAAGPASERNDIVYVGRLEPSKKVRLMLEAFALAANSEHSMHFRIAGEGSELTFLQEFVHQNQLEDRVTFLGSVTDVNRLRTMYAAAFCSVSPGFAGLGLTQSLGFGVPQLVADKEPHSPEIELAEVGGVDWFETGNANSMANQMIDLYRRRSEVPDNRLVRYISEFYSAEAMANGIGRALGGEE